MNKYLMPMLAIASVSCFSCNGTRNTNQDANDNAANNQNLTGKWRIENVVINDSLYAMPIEETPEEYPYITFGDDGSYFIQTNCNSISGSYALKGDSIKLDNGARTEMACDNMRVEDLIVRVLPIINNIDIQSDTVARLGSASEACIILTRSEAPMI